MKNDLISEFFDGTRYVGIWSSPPKYARQIPVKSRDEVVDILKIYNGVYNCGISMCSFINEVPHLLYLPFDFDSSKDLKLAWDDASKLYNMLVDCNYDVTLNFSGFRGYHIVLSVYPRPYTRPQIRVAQKFFTEVLGLKTQDKQIFGDIRRLLKIPGTVHCGKFEKVNSHWKRIGEGGMCETIAYHNGELLDIDELVEESKEYVSEFNGNHKDNKPMPSYTCLKLHINNEEPPQDIRYSYVAMLVNQGYEIDEIVAILKRDHSSSGKWPWVDWDEDLTTKQVEHIYNADTYNPPRCDTLKEMGYCIKECVDNLDDWKPISINKFKRK